MDLETMEILEVSVETLSERAEQLFIEYNHFDLSKLRYQRMMKDALSVWEKGAKGIHPRAAVRFYQDVQIQEDCLQIGKITVRCKAFSKIETSMVQGAFVYCLNAGKCVIEDDAGVLKQMYANVWGTVWVDLTREYLERRLQEDAAHFVKNDRKACFLSPSYGPGFFGMETGEAYRIGQMVDTEAVGVCVTESGVLLPEQSCSGIYLLLDNKEAFPDPACAECLGISTSCHLCRLNHLEKG